MTYGVLGATRHFDLMSMADAERPRESPLPEPTEADVMPTAPLNECSDYADAEIGLMVRMYCNGCDTTEIAEEIGEPVNARQVAATLTHLKQKLANPKPKKAKYQHKVTDEQILKMVDEWNAGWTLRKLAEKYHLSLSGVQWVMRKYKDDMA